MLRRLALLFLILLPAPLAAQTDFSTDPSGPVPDGWSSAQDPSVTFGTVGLSNLEIGDYGSASFGQALKETGNGGIVVDFGRTIDQFSFWAGNDDFAGSPGRYWIAWLWRNGGRIGAVSGTLNGTHAMDQQVTVNHSLFDRAELYYSAPSADAVIDNLAYHAVATPEPVSLVLLGTGLLGLGAVGWRRRRRQEAV